MKENVHYYAILHEISILFNCLFTPIHKTNLIIVLWVVSRMVIAETSLLLPSLHNNAKILLPCVLLKFFSGFFGAKKNKVSFFEVLSPHDGGGAHGAR